MKEPLIIKIPASPRDGRGNTHIWNSLDWNQPIAAIARALRVDPRSVAHQRKLRGLPACKRGGPRYPGRKLAYKSSLPLPTISRPL